MLKFKHFFSKKLFGQNSYFTPCKKCWQAGAGIWDCGFKKSKFEITKVLSGLLEAGCWILDAGF